MRVSMGVNANDDVDLFCECADVFSLMLIGKVVPNQRSGNGKTVMSHDDTVDGQAPDQASISTRVGAGSNDRTNPHKDTPAETDGQPNQESRTPPPAPSPTRSLDR